jgi:hypothetical protein
MSSPDDVDPKIQAKVAPIVIYDIEDDYKNNPTQLKNYLQSNNLHSKINYTSTDRNNNLTIFAKSVADAADLMKDASFFSSLRKTNLNDDAHKPAVIVKDLSYESAKEFETELTELGVVEIIDLAPKTAKLFADATLPKRAQCKLTLQTSAIRENLIKSKLMLGCRRYHVEPSVHVVQCKKCKRFNHTAAKCQHDQACGRCSMVHDEIERDESDMELSRCDLAFCCINCGEGHSSYDRSCKAYQQAKYDALNKLNPQARPQENLKRPTSYIQPSASYSQATNANSTNISAQFDAIMAKLTKMELQRGEDLATIKNYVDAKVENAIEQNNVTTDTKIAENNFKLGNVIVSALSSMLKDKNDAKGVAKVVQDKFKDYHLGDLGLGKDESKTAKQQPTPKKQTASNSRSSSSSTTTTVVPQQQSNLYHNTLANMNLICQPFQSQNPSNHNFFLPSSVTELSSRLNNQSTNY